MFLSKLYVEKKMHYIAVIYNVIFSFYSHFSAFFYFGFATVGYIVLKTNYFGPNKSFFKIGMNTSGSLWSSIANRNSPRPYFFFPGSKIGLLFYKFVGRANQF